MSEIREQLSSIWIEIKETLHLNLDYAKLTATEKITVLLSTIAIVLICFAVGSIVIFLVALGLLLSYWRTQPVLGAR